MSTTSVFDIFQKRVARSVITVKECAMPGYSTQVWFVGEGTFRREQKMWENFNECYKSADLLCTVSSIN